MRGFGPVSLLSLRTPYHYSDSTMDGRAKSYQNTVDNRTSYDYTDRQ